MSAARRRPRPDAAAVESPARHGRAAALAAGLLLVVGLIALHAIYHRHAGPLWRDEVNSVNVASQPSFAEVYAHAKFDSFPPLWTALLHAWTDGFGSSDEAVRRLGLLIGLALLAALWWAGWRLGTGPPLVALLLFGMSPTAIIYGDEVRGYGLAAIAIVCCFGAFWAYVERPSAASFAVASGAALFAVQTHYANCLLLLAIGGGAAAVLLHRRSWTHLGAVVAIGLGAALAVVWVNRPALEYMSETSPLIVATWSLSFLLQVFAHAVAPGLGVLSGAWAAAFGLAALGFALAWRSPRATGDRDRALYAAATLVVALVGYFFALRLAGLGIQYWHYLSLMAVLALSLEVGVVLLARRFALGETLRVAAVGLAALASAPGVAEAVPLRMTNVDLAAQEIAKLATAKDLVIVLPWYAGLTFDRYYRGATPWITIPDLREHELHRHLEIADRMKRGGRAVDAELERVAETLRGGGRVWVVGEIQAPDAGTSLEPLPPAPGGPRGWHADPYLASWEAQLGGLLESRGTDRARVPLPDAGKTNAWETLPVGVVWGWR